MLNVALWDRCSPMLIIERKARLRFYLKFLLLSYPNNLNLVHFLKAQSFSLPPEINQRLHEIGENTDQEAVYYLHLEVQRQLGIIKNFVDRLRRLRRSIKIYGVFWNAGLKSKKNLLESFETFAEARSFSTLPFNEVVSKYNRERVLLGGDDVHISLLYQHFDVFID